MTIKKISLLVATLLFFAGCATTEQLYPEDELFITRKYAGQYVSNIAPTNVRFGDAPVMSIFTTISDFDTIKIYAKKFPVPEGTRLYLRRTRHYGSQFSYPYYILEAGDRTFRICEFGLGDKLLTQTWY